MSGHVVELSGLGRLQGVVEKSVDGDFYLAFKGVPYAKPPLGKLRFAVSLRLIFLKEVNSRRHIINQGLCDCAHRNAERY